MGGVRPRPKWKVAAKARTRRADEADAPDEEGEEGEGADELQEEALEEDEDDDGVDVEAAARAHTYVVGFDEDASVPTGAQERSTVAKELAMEPARLGH